MTVILRLINMVYTNDKGPGSMSHLFVLERITAHIYMRGQIKFATRLPVLCSVLLFLIRIIKQRFEGHNSFSLLVCVLSEAKEMEKIMAFFESAVGVLQTLVVALGAGLGVWGVINLMEGYGNDNPGAKSQGMKQLMAGGGVALIGTTLVPLLSGLF